MLLQNKNAILYGGGPICGAVAQAFAREGARVFLTGRNLTKMQALATKMHEAGGMAEVAEVDALDEPAVDVHANAVAATAGIEKETLLGRAATLQMSVMWLPL